MHQLSLELTASNKSDGCGTKDKVAKIWNALGAGFHGGTLVIADTKAQVVKACRGNDFMLIVYGCINAQCTEQSCTCLTAL